MEQSSGDEPPTGEYDEGCIVATEPEISTPPVAAVTASGVYDKVAKVTMAKLKALGARAVEEYQEPCWTRLDVALLQLQTRYQDFLAGHLATGYFHSCLEQTASIVRDCEATLLAQDSTSFNKAATSILESSSSLSSQFELQWDTRLGKYYYLNTETGARFDRPIADALPPQES
eukprot:UC1_evm1s1141